MALLSDILTRIDCQVYGDPEWHDKSRPLMPNFDETFYTIVKSLSGNPFSRLKTKGLDGCGYKVPGNLVVGSSSALLVSSRCPLSPTWIESNDGIVLAGSLSTSSVRAYSVDLSKANPWYLAYKISEHESMFEAKCNMFGTLSEDDFLNANIELPSLIEQDEFVKQQMSRVDMQTTDISTNESLGNETAIPAAVAFLGQFSKAKGLKYLTHGFDPESYSDSEDDFYEYVDRCRYALGEVKGKVPDSLYKLVFGFVAGPSWTDCDGNIHHNHCACEAWADWIDANPACHPSDEFIEEFKAFKNSIRIYNGTLDDYFENLNASGRFTTIKLDVDPDLEKFDSYMDVRQFRAIVTKFLDDVDRYPDAKEHPIVKISHKSLAPLPDKTKVDEVRLTQVGSFPTQDIQQALGHFNNSGGLLASLKSLAEGHFFLSLETCWARRPIRWNLNASLSESVLEDLPQEDVTGYTLVITVLHKG